MNVDTVVIQITTQCHFDCAQCYMERGREDIPFAMACSVIDEARQNGAKMLQITGGEPMLHPRIFDVIAYANKNGMLSALATSGYGLNLETIVQLQKNGLNALCVSLNGFSKNIDKKSRDSHAPAINAIEITKNINFFKFINFVARKDNIDDLEKLIGFAYQNNISGINILNNIENFKGELNSGPDENGLNKLAALIKKHPGFLNVEHCYFRLQKLTNPETKIQCDALVSTYFVNVDGSYSPCSKTLYLKRKTLTELYKVSRDFQNNCYTNNQSPS